MFLSKNHIYIYIYVVNFKVFVQIVSFSVIFMDLRGIFKSCEPKAHQPEMAALKPINWSDIDEAQPTPGLAVSRESMRAAEEVETTTRMLQED